MKNKVFIGNLPWSTTTEDLVTLLRKMGYAFRSAKVVDEEETGRSRGFAFVEFATPEGVEQAIKNLNDYVLDGRTLQVAEAKERVDRSGGGTGEREPQRRLRNAVETNEPGKDRLRSGTHG
jgi:RNA-binding proteins (RRM domain)